MIIDIDVMESNLESMARLTREHAVALWPNSKSHKTPAIAWRQIAGGAAGVTCQKLGEAEVMVNAGLQDILVAVQVIGAAKVERLRRLARQARVTTVVDSVDGASAISDAFCAHGMVVEALIEVDIGYRRCGVQPEEADHLATAIARDMPGLLLVGVMGYEGHLYDLAGKPAVLAAARDSYALLIQVAGRLRDRGIEMKRVSVGATSAAEVAVTQPGITEIRAGSYLFNDLSQMRMGWAAEKDCAATVVATVISVPAPDRAVIDAGAKALTSTTVAGLEGFGAILGHPRALIERLSDEHGMIVVKDNRMPFRVGDRVRVIPNSHTVVVNQFSEIHGVRNGEVEWLWPVAARGRMQ